MPPMDTDDDRHYWRYTLNRQCPTGRVLIFSIQGADRASNDADVSSIPPIIPYGGFSPVRLEGWLPSGAFPTHQRPQPAPGMRRPMIGLHPPFVRLVVTTVVPHCVGPRTRFRTAVEDHYSSAPGALARVRVIVSRSVIT